VKGKSIARNFLGCRIPKEAVSMADNFFELSAVANNGRTVDFRQYQGMVVLVVNTASKCGFTPQYKALEQLFRDFRDEGFVVLGFPCDQFAHQEPGSDEEIAQFCQINFGVTFPLMSKVKVNGKEAHPVYNFLKERAPGTIGKAIKWNFTKFLVGRDGSTITRYSPATPPDEIRADLEKALGG